MVPPHSLIAGPDGPGEGRKGEERSIRMKVSREGGERHQESRKRGESPQLKVESMGKGDYGGNQVPPGPGCYELTSNLLLIGQILSYFISGR